MVCCGNGGNARSALSDRQCVFVPTNPTNVTFCISPIIRYETLLRRARSEDLTEVSGIGCLYQSGVDRLGRPVVVFCGKWFPAHQLDLEKALLYLILLLDPIVKGDYVIAYFHTLTSSNNYPALHWLRDVYTVLPYK